MRMVNKMKCKECSYARRGWFKSIPEAYVCIGVKEPFVISNYPDAECTEYQWDEIKTEKIHEPEPAKAFVDDDGIYIPHESNPRYHKLLISKDLFVEAYNKWIKGECTNE